MPTRIRLQRKGKKGRPFYHIVIADGRAPRDGKYIERIGTYNPVAVPAEINIDFDRALYWVKTGAQPSDTVRNILSYKGVMYKYHLLRGVEKGAMNEEQAEAKFDAWMNEKLEKISGRLKEKESSERETLKGRHEAEKKVNEDRAKALAEKRAAELKKEQAAKAGADVEDEVSNDVEASDEESEVEETPVAEVAAVEEEVVVEEEAPVEEIAAVEEVPAVKEAIAATEAEVIEEVPAEPEAKATEEEKPAE